MRYRDVARPLAPESAVGAVETRIGLVPGLVEVRLPSGETVDQALARYRAQANVLYATPNRMISAAMLPNDPSFGLLWGLNNTGQSGGTHDADIDAPEAWNTRRDASGVIVAVIDTGINLTHPDLAANIWTNTSEANGLPGVDDDGNGYVDDVHGYDFANDDDDPGDDHGHGTHVAGTIGAVGGNGIGVTGVAWSVQLMALKFLNAEGYGSDADAIRALDYAVGMGARISNNSYGDTEINPAFADAIAAAGASGHQGQRA